MWLLWINLKYDITILTVPNFADTVKPILRDHSLPWETTWQKIPHFSAIKPVTKDHLSWETIFFLWLIGQSFQIGFTVFFTEVYHLRTYRRPRFSPWNMPSVLWGRGTLGILIPAFLKLATRLDLLLRSPIRGALYMSPSTGRVREAPGLLDMVPVPPPG